MHPLSAAVLLLPALAWAADMPEQSPLERGRYLVTKVGMCIDCHSPRDQTGAFVAGRTLQGSKLGFAPTVPMPAWADTAPRISGTAYPPEYLRVLLTTGKRPDGLMPRPPMPSYEMTQTDADAVIAFLRSLP